VGPEGADVAAYKWGQDCGDGYNFRHRFYYSIKMRMIDFVGQFEFELEQIWNLTLSSQLFL
jgi:hypothetical protein